MRPFELGSLRVARQSWRNLVTGPYRRWSQARERKHYQQLWDKQLTCDAANTAIADLLRGREPCLVGRIGHTEGRIVGEHIFYSSRYSRISCKQAHQNAGIFPVNSSVLSVFAEIYSRSIATADLLGFWQTTHQSRLLATFYPDMPLAPLSALEPYLHQSPWSAALKGRRVLVVHPFAESIRRQYEQNCHIIFGDSAVLPEMNLRVLKPPQTLAPLTAGYSSWIEALDDLIDRVLLCEFDVALLGCGAYGLPLGAAIKRAGRQAIHLGGALQVLFGIRGKRWEQNPSISRLMNDHWIRPSREETPESFALVEEGCYW